MGIFGFCQYQASLKKKRHYLPVVLSRHFLIFLCRWRLVATSVAGSGMFIPDPDLPVSDARSRIQKQQQKICCHTFLCNHKFYKIINYFSFEVLKKKIWANFQRIIELFTQKIVTKLSEIWVWDPGSEIRDPEKTYSGSRIPDSGVKKAPDPRSGSATLVATAGKVVTPLYYWCTGI
jgi:hypothetical protein